MFKFDTAALPHVVALRNLLQFSSSHPNWHWSGHGVHGYARSSLRRIVRAALEENTETPEISDAVHNAAWDEIAPLLNESNFVDLVESAIQLWISEIDTAS